MARVVDVKLFDGDLARAADIVLGSCSQGEPKNLLISATDAHGIVTAHLDAEFRRVLDSFFLNLADGMPSVWISRLKGDKHIQRCYGPDFLKAVMIATRDQDIRHYLCGGKDGVAQDLKQVCKDRFQNPNIVGVCSPPFRDLSDEEMMQLAADINASGADIVWIGLGTPKQERFAVRLACYTRAHFLCTVGAAFDFHTGRVKQAPRWIQRMGLEWAFRLLMEPGRLWKRYFVVVPLFVVYNVVDLFRYFVRPDQETNLT